MRAAVVAADPQKGGPNESPNTTRARGGAGSERAR